MGIIGEEFILVRPETTGFVSKLKAQLGAGGGPQLGGFLGASVVAGLGAGLFAVGEKFQTTYNRIKVQTGATGKVFDTLKTDVKAVLGSTAGSFAQVGAAIGGLYARTHLTGAALDQLAKQQVVLGRITKTDVGANVDATTKLFAKYGIAAKDQGKHLDVLFKASQAAGISIDQIIAPLQKGGSALQVFGFGLDKSAALIASLTKAGVNVGPALMSLRSAFGKIAKEGGDPVKVFANLQKSLLSGKDPAKAMAQAMALLGSRGGLELGNAIKSGKFNLDAMLKSITDGKGGILQTGSEVSTLGGKFQLLKNKVIVAIEPIATKLVDLANNKLAGVVKWIDKMGGLAGIWERWKTPILVVVAALALWFAPFEAIIAGLIILYQKNAMFRQIVAQVADVIQTRVIPAFQAIAHWVVDSAIPALQRFADYMRGTVWPVVQQVAAYIIGQFQTLVGAVQARWNDIQAAIHNALIAIEVIVGAVLAPILFIWQNFHTQIIAVLSAAWTYIQTTVRATLLIIKGIFDVVLGLLSGHWGRAWNGIKEIFAGVWLQIQNYVHLGWVLIQNIFTIGLQLLITALTTWVPRVLLFFATLPFLIVAKLGQLGVRLALWAGAGFATLVSALPGIAADLLSWFFGLPGRILKSIPDVASTLIGIGTSIVTGLIKGLEAAWSDVWNFFSSKLGSLWGFFKGLFGIGSPSKKFHWAGEMMMKGLANGIRAGAPGAQDALGHAMGQLGASGFAALPGGRGAVGGVTIQSLTLAPVFPPGMDGATAMAELKVFAKEELATTLESVQAGHTVKTGTGR